MILTGLILPYGRKRAIYPAYTMNIGFLCGEVSSMETLFVPANGVVGIIGMGLYQTEFALIHGSRNS